MTTRKSLSDILREGEQESLAKEWDKTEAAEEFAPLPTGEYVARIIAGALFISTKGTPGYKLSFRVLEGDHAGRQFWDDIWLTPAALPMAKRDLLKLGVKALEQLENPLPPGIRCRVKLTKRTEDDGTEFNKVRRFDVLGIDTPEPDAFAPGDSPPAEGNKSEDAVAEDKQTEDDEVEDEQKRTGTEKRSGRRLRRR